MFVHRCGEMVHSFNKMICTAFNWVFICIWQCYNHAPCLCPKTQKKEKHAPIHTVHVMCCTYGMGGGFVITLLYRHLAGSHRLLQNMFPCCCRSLRDYVKRAMNPCLCHSHCHWLTCKGLYVPSPAHSSFPWTTPPVSWPKVQQLFAHIRKNRKSCATDLVSQKTYRLYKGSCSTGLSLCQWSLLEYSCQSVYLRGIKINCGVYPGKHNFLFFLANCSSEFIFTFMFFFF